MKQVTTTKIDLIELLYGAVAEVETATAADTDDKHHDHHHHPNHAPDFVTATLVLDCHCELGEGILYDDVKHAILWTDILRRQFHKLQLSHVDQTTTKQHVAIHSVYELPKMLGSFGLLQQSKEHNVTDDDTLPLLCAWEDGFQLYDIAKGIALSEMSRGECVNPRGLPSRLNDGRVDPLGQRFICGGYYGDMEDVQMKVYKVVQQEGASSTGSRILVHEPIVHEITTTNSVCWSNDGNTMYLADSPTKQIHSYQYNSVDGTVSDKLLVHTKPMNAWGGVPDGSCIDAEGYIWNAVWKGGMQQSCVQRIDPRTGNVVFTVHMPDGTSQVTCCCFGGAERNILFITSAAESTNPQKEPHAGGLYAVKLPFRGCNEKRLQFTYEQSK